MTRRGPFLSLAALLLALGLASGCASSTPPGSPRAPRPSTAPPLVQEAEDASADGATSSAPKGKDDPEAVDDYEDGPHFISLFAGGTLEDGERNGQAVGLDYSYKFQDGWEVGMFTEFVVDTDRSIAMGFFVARQVVADLHLLAAPGAEEKNKSWGPLLRLGAYYEFSVGGSWTLSPAAFHDWTDEGTHILGGVLLGYRL